MNSQQHRSGPFMSELREPTGKESLGISAAHSSSANWLTNWICVSSLGDCLRLEFSDAAEWGWAAGQLIKQGTERIFRAIPTSSAECAVFADKMVPDFTEFF